MLGAGGIPARQPRCQGAARDPRVLPARLAIPDRDRRAFRRSRWGSSASASVNASACSSAVIRLTGSSLAWSAFRAIASTPRTASGSVGSCVEAFGGTHARLDAASIRVAACADSLHRPLRRSACPRTSIAGRSRQRSSARHRGPGPTTCAKRCSRSCGRSEAHSSTGATSTHSRPPTVPIGRRRRPSPTSPDSRSSRRTQRADRRASISRRQPRRPRPLQALQLRRRVALRRAADVRAHGGQGRR